jgi:hypothetical protein
MFAKDPDQEISPSFAYGPIDGALRKADKHVGDDPVVREIRELFSLETIAEDRPITVGEVLKLRARAMFPMDGEVDAITKFIETPEGQDLRARHSAAEPDVVGGPPPSAEPPESPVAGGSEGERIAKQMQEGVEHYAAQEGISVSQAYEVITGAEWYRNLKRQYDFVRAQDDRGRPLNPVTRALS